MAITERYLATGVERCICMKESVYTLGRANNCLLFAKLREASMFQSLENRYIDLGCVFGRKLLKIQTIKTIGKQNITTLLTIDVIFLLISHQVFPGSFSVFFGRKLDPLTKY